jgi:hypothetical protein
MEALLVVFSHLFLAISVLTLFFVSYESQIGGSRGVSVSPAGKRRELRLESDAIVLEGGAFPVTGETEALQFLLLTSEGGSDGDDVIEFLNFSLQAHRTLVVLQLPDSFFVR